MEEKGDVCDSSEEAASLVAELSIFINATQREQTDRVSQVWCSQLPYAHR